MNIFNILFGGGEEQSYDGDQTQGEGTHGDAGREVDAGPQEITDNAWSSLLGWLFRADDEDPGNRN
jgi:hypothetical protein